MSTTQIREILHHYIDVADDQMIQILYTLVKEYKEENYEISEEHKKILEIKIESQKNNPCLESNWEEVKKRLLEKI